MNHEQKLRSVLADVVQPEVAETIVADWKAQVRQDSLNDQLKDLAEIANLAGMYDAADFINHKILKRS